MAYKYPICDVFHWFCKIARFFATEPVKKPIKTLGWENMKKLRPYLKKVFPWQKRMETSLL